MKAEIEKRIFGYRNYFFDFDGVVSNSLGIKADVFSILFKEYGDDIVKKVRDYHVANGGVSRYDKFRYYYEVLLNKPITQEIISRLDRVFSEKVIEKVVRAGETPGVRDFLRELARRGKTCFMISATPQGEIQEILRRKELNGYFKETAGSPVSKKENLKSILEKFSLSASKSVFFGDAKSDYNAAGDNGMDFIAVTCWSNELSYMKDTHRIADFTVYLNTRSKNA